ncbi:MAG: hypothetical protein AB1609_01665 [Bacillota bacterium]
MVSVLAALGMAAAFVSQAFIPEASSHGTTWGVAAGWQREIAFWNVAMVTAVLLALRSGRDEVSRVVATSLVVLGTGLGTNHAAAFLAGARSGVPLFGATGGTLWHAYGPAVNYAGVLLSVYALAARRRAR